MTTSENRNKMLSAVALFLAVYSAFGINLSKIGVYLDEWISFGKLHFMDHSLANLIYSYLLDAKVIVRPLEALHYPVLFYFFGINPFPYHLVNTVSEYLAALFFFLFLEKLSKNSSLALAAALLYLLMPNHDATHYSIVASSIAVAAAFLTLSLYLFAFSFERHKSLFLSLAAVSFACSIYHYEFALPFLALFPLVSLYKNQTGSIRDRLIKVLIENLPFLFVALSMVLFRTKFLPTIQKGLSYSVVCDSSHFFDVIAQGLAVNFAPAAQAFYWSLLSQPNSMGLAGYIWLFATLLVSFKLMAKAEAGDKKTTALALFGLGLLLVPISYTIYGFSPEHMPVLETGMNRVNAGAALGVSLVLSSAVYLFASVFGNLSKKVFAALISLLVAAFILIDWQFATPWIVSWQAQKQIQQAIKNNAAKFEGGDGILLVGIGRFIRWAPVLDGTWDFQNSVRIILENPKINATVLSDRIKAGNEGLIDSFGNLTLTELKYDRLWLFFCQKGLLLKVQSKAELEEKLRENGVEIK
ncbi:MAG: hypothetical protein J0M35_13900 [Candidatus Obscuribacter phosphatis]|uniref:Glycosyltransferase RgtA/B/C/D-like domain-containing protein n=1 Tax=Candidatus Obscuribacter phosphatis TaxID=1906157 RepID=A0A8J7P860_9BACT|nr:hypothetical protein [Candidatus Obscuribacter phosphatis]